MADSDNLIKNGLSVYINPTGGTGSTAGLEAVAYAQSYTFDASADTFEVSSLSDCDSDWANPSQQVKSWTVSTDALVVRDSYITGTTDTGQQDFIDYFLADTEVTVAVGGEGCGLGDDESWLEGLAIVTSFSQSGTVGEYQTYSVTFTGKGAFRRIDLD